MKIENTMVENNIVHCMSLYPYISLECSFEQKVKKAYLQYIKL